MSYDTYFNLLNADDEEFIRVKNSPNKDDWNDWEDEHGDIELFPGAPVEAPDDLIEELPHEYGGWLIDLSKIPKNATHILVSRA